MRRPRSAPSGLAAAGTLYGALSAGLRVRETLLPFLLLPVAAPGAAGRDPGVAGGLGLGGHRPCDAGTRGSACCSVFDAVYLALGVVVYGPLQEAA